MFPIVISHKTTNEDLSVVGDSFLIPGKESDGEKSFNPSLFQLNGTKTRNTNI